MSRGNPFSRGAAYQNVRRYLPPARNFPCKDCGKQAEEYDHYDGYLDWRKVHPVCKSCHTKREISRGKNIGKYARVLNNKIGPRMKDGRFLSIQATKQRRSERAIKRLAEVQGCKS